MNIKDLESQIKNNYKNIQNYLQGDPGAEGFLDSLANLQINFANYLIEVLKTKKYSGKDAKKSNIYQGHIKGGEHPYIDDERLEQMISNKVLGKKVSIDSLMDKGIKRLKELFTIKKSLETGAILNIQDIILPPKMLTLPTGSGKGFKIEKKQQNKLLLFISILRELGIYNHDFIIYSGNTSDNMMRESGYYAIFIPKINKTIFLNMGYGEATFVCEGKISPENMTTLGKEELQDKLGAIKIKFFENNIYGWKCRLKTALLGEGGNNNGNERKNKIYSKDELHIIKDFYDKHKNYVFTDSEGNQATINDFFSIQEYYHKNYKIVNNIFGLKLPAKPRTSYKMTWNKFKEEIGRNFATIENLQSFYSSHKDEDIVKESFSSLKSYFKNYEKINEIYGINLPGNPCEYYKIKRTEFKKRIGVLATIKELQSFYSYHKDEDIVKELFSSLGNYFKNYERVNEIYGIKLPANITDYYGKKWNDLIKEITGIEKKKIAKPSKL